MTVTSLPPQLQLYLRRLDPALAIAVVLFLLAAACAPWRCAHSEPTVPGTTSRFYFFDLVHEYPHDPDAFTEGLLYGGTDTLFESTGLYHKSSVREVHLQTGKVLVQKHLDEGDMFGEGLALLGNRLFQLTWMTNVGFIYGRHNFTKVYVLPPRESFTHPMTDGWGLATDGKVLFGTDGTSKLYHLDAESIEVRKEVTVKYQDNEVPFLNELEYVNGEVWANVYPTDCIARISPDDGQVVGWIFLHELKQHLLDLGHTNIDVLNGIAWDEDMSRLFITGKWWPKLYEIKLRPVDGPSDGSVENLCPKYRLKSSI